MEVLAGDANANVDMKVSQDVLWCDTRAYSPGALLTKTMGLNASSR